MNKLIFVAVAAAAASGIAAAPAVAGLSNNPSFSHQLPVRAPSGAQPVTVGDERSLAAHPSPSASPSAVNEADDLNAADFTDDNYGAAAEPGDDNGRDGASLAPQPAATVAHVAEVEPGDDKGGTAETASVAPPTAVAESGDDKGGASSGHVDGGGGGGGDH